MSQPTPPIEDAVTVAYVDIIHALSEMNEALDLMRFHNLETDDLVLGIEDLRRAQEMLYPHVVKANPAGIVVGER